MFKKRISVLLCLVLVLGLGTWALGEERTIVDMKGRSVTIPEAVTRVVAMAPADCEILYALGAEDVLVGRGMDCDYPQAVEAVPVVNSGATTNLEQIIALEPQLVLMNTMAQPLEQVQALEASGISVIATDTTNIQGVYEAIALIGALVSRQEEAGALVTQMQEAFAALHDQGAQLQGKTVYFEVSPLQYGLWTAGKNTFLDEIAAVLGLRNAFADVDGWAEVSQEQVIARDPDVIVTLFGGDGSAVAPAEEIKARVGWEGLAAVKGGAVLAADPNEISRPGPRLVTAAENLLAFVKATLSQKGVSP